MSKKPGSDPQSSEMNRSRKTTGDTRDGLMSLADIAVTSQREAGLPSPVTNACASIPPTIRTALPASGVSADEDLAIYLDRLPGWGGHQGEHVLIHGGQVHGFFPTRGDARREAFRRFGRVAFLVKQVDLHEKPRPLVGVIL